MRILFALLLLSCSKEVPIQETKAVTYLRDTVYNGNYRDTSIHWCNVSGPDLKRFESYSKEPQNVCGVWFKLIIEPDKCKLK